MIKIGDKEVTSIDAAMDPKLWDGLGRIAASRVNGGQVPPGVKTVDQAMNMILFGIDMGYQPGLALDNLQLIGNKFSLPANSMWALVIQQTKSVPEIVFSSDERATVALSSDTRPRMELSFTIEEAKRAKLAGDNWTKYPQYMLLARAKSALVRNYAPDVVGGIYSNEELENESFVSQGPVDALTDSGYYDEDGGAQAPKAKAKTAPKAQPKAPPVQATAPVAPQRGADAPESPRHEADKTAKAAETATTIMDAMSGRVAESSTEPLVGKYIVAVMNGIHLDKSKTAAHMVEVLTGALGGDRTDAIKRLKDKTVELGAAKSAELDIVNYTALFRWVDALIDDLKAAELTDTDEPAEFNPARGTGTTGAGALVEDGTALDLDEAIAAAWGTLSQDGKVDEANAAMEETTYSDTLSESSNTVKQATLVKLQELLG